MPEIGQRIDARLGIGVCLPAFGSDGTVGPDDGALRIEESLWPGIQKRRRRRQFRHSLWWNWLRCVVTPNTVFVRGGRSRPAPEHRIKGVPEVLTPCEAALAESVVAISRGAVHRCTV
jgi:hypothetical protein